MIPGRWPEYEEKHITDNTGCSVNECRMCPHKDSANITITLRNEENWYYTLVPARWPECEANSNLSNTGCLVNEYFLIRKQLIRKLCQIPSCCDLTANEWPRSNRTTVYMHKTLLGIQNRIIGKLSYFSHWDRNAPLCAILYSAE